MEASSADGDTKPAANDVEPKPEKIEEVREEGPSHHCDLCDKELAYKIAQDMLSGLATACVDSTTGAIFKSPAAVAAEVRKEMVDYLTTRSEGFVAESVLEGALPDAEISDHPYDVLSHMIDDFAIVKRNLWSRVSGWALSEVREDKIDEFVQGMERDRFWLLDRRETVARTLIKNVDFKNLYHCDMKFNSEEEVKKHQETCGFRTLMCENEGCNETYSAKNQEQHDSTCEFKMLPCEQKCSDFLMRRDMDRHCITNCPMKLANCPFYSIGCQSPVPQSLIKKHCTESTHVHLLNALQFIHKEASKEDAEHWAEQIEKSQFSDDLDVRDVRTLTRIVKDIEKRIGPFKAVERKPETIEDTPSPSEPATTTASQEDTAQDKASSPVDQAETKTEDKQTMTTPPPLQQVTPAATHDKVVGEPPENVTAPPHEPPQTVTETAPPHEPPVTETAPPHEPPETVTETAPPHEPPVTETAPPHEPPETVTKTAPPHEPPVTETAPPHELPETVTETAPPHELPETVTPPPLEPPKTEAAPPHEPPTTEAAPPPEPPATEAAPPHEPSTTEAAPPHEPPVSPPRQAESGTPSHPSSSHDQAETPAKAAAPELSSETKN